MKNKELLTIAGIKYKFGVFNFLFRLSHDGEWKRSSFDVNEIKLKWVLIYKKLMKKPKSLAKKATANQKKEHELLIKKLQKQHLDVVSEVLQNGSWMHITPYCQYKPTKQTK